MMIVGHICIPAALEVQRHFYLSVGVQFLGWLIVMMAMTLWLLPVVKGALINLQWAKRMHGFSQFSETPDSQKLGV